MGADSTDAASDEPTDAAGEDADATDGGDEPTDSASDAATADGGADAAPAAETGERAPNTLLNALLGAAVGLFLVFVAPVSPVIGGAVSGYLEGPDLREGAKVGAIAGGLASLLAVGIVGTFALFLVVTAPPDALFVVFGLAVLVGTVAAFLVASFAVGGVLGAYVRRERLLGDL